MVRVRIRMMMVIMIVPVVMMIMVVMAVIMRVVMSVVSMRLGLAGAGALAITEVATLANALDMVVMAFLPEAYFSFKSENLLPILAQRTVHVISAVKNFGHPVGERL